MLSYYFWCMWAITMSKNSDIMFDYVEHAHSMYNKYISVK